MPKLWKCNDALSGLISYQGGEGFTLVLTALHALPADRPEPAVMAEIRSLLARSAKKEWLSFYSFVTQFRKLLTL